MFSFSHAPPASRIFLGFLMAILAASVSFVWAASAPGAFMGQFYLSGMAIFFIPVALVATSFVIVVYLPLYLVALAGRWTNVYYIVGWTFVVNSLIVFAPAFHSIWDAVLEGRGTTYRITDSCLAAIGAFVFWLIVHAEIPKLRKNLPPTPRVAGGLVTAILFAAVLMGLIKLAEDAFIFFPGGGFWNFSLWSIVVDICLGLVVSGIYLPLYLLAVVYNRISFWWLVGSAFFINTLIPTVLVTINFKEKFDLLNSYTLILESSVLVAAGVGVFWFVVYKLPFPHSLKEFEHS